MGKASGPASSPTFAAELVPSRSTRQTAQTVENLVQTLALQEPLALEFAGTDCHCRILVRTGSRAGLENLVAHLESSAPQVEIRPLTPLPGRSLPALTDPLRRADPLALSPDEVVECLLLQLARPPYFPLNTHWDAGTGARSGRNTANRWNEASQGGDPIAGILGALAQLHPGERLVSQLVLLPAPPNWAASYQRLALEHPIERERERERRRERSRSAPPASGSAGTSLGGLLPLLLLGLGVRQVFP